MKKKIYFLNSPVFLLITSSLLALSITSNAYATRMWVNFTNNSGEDLYYSTTSLSDCVSGNNKAGSGTRVYDNGSGGATSSLTMNKLYICHKNDSTKYLKITDTSFKLNTIIPLVSYSPSCSHNSVDPQGLSISDFTVASDYGAFKQSGCVLTGDISVSTD